MNERSYTYRTNDRKVVSMMLLGLVVLFGGLYVAGYLYSSDRLPLGTTIAGVDLGGMRPAAAETALHDAVASRLSDPIVVRAHGTRAAIDPAAAGLGVDVAATVAKATHGPNWSPARMWSYFTGGDDVEPVVTADRLKLDRAVARFATKVDRPAREGGVTFARGQATPHYPRNGSAVDQNATVNAVLKAFLRNDGVVSARTRTVPPEISAADVSRAMNSFGNPAVSGPVTIRLGRATMVLTPAQYTPAISLVREDGVLMPWLDKQRLLHIVGPRLKGIAVRAKDATVAIVDGTPTVSPGRDGLTFDPRQLTRHFLRAVAAHDNGRVLVLRGVVEKPKLTTAKATGFGISSAVGESAATYDVSADAAMKTAAANLNGRLIRPGHQLNLGKLLANGAGSGVAVTESALSDPAGGLNPLATAVFDAATSAGLETGPHGFRATTAYGVLVEAWADQGKVHVRLWSTKQDSGPAKHH